MINKNSSLKSIKFLMVLIVFISMSTVAMSQNKVNSLGYMGRQFAVKYNFGLSASMPFPQLKLPISNGIGIEYVTKERRSIILSYDYTGYSKQTPFLSSTNGCPSCSGVYDIVNKKHSLMIFSRRYSASRGSFAPYGNYFGLGVGVLKQKITNFTKADFENEYRYAESGYPDIKFGIEVGRQFVTLDRMLIDVQMRFALPIITTRKVANGSNYNSIDVVGNPYLDTLISELFQLRIGIGFLAF